MEHDSPADTLWGKVLSHLRVSVSEGSFNAYLRPTRLTEIKEDELAITVLCQSVFVKHTLEQRFLQKIQEQITQETGKKYTVIIKVDTEKPLPLHKTSSHSQEVGTLFEGKKIIQEHSRKANLRDDYTFETYAVSGSNQMAFAAAQAVARNPGQSYNPLFIYGGVGVGKTHLMQAIGHAVVERGDGQVLFCSGEEFTNDLVEAIRFKSTEKVRAKYRRLKVLMVDDVQFIAGKPSVQEEFFHTFNSILKDGGQVIMTSDKPPSEIAKLEERLRSRFGAGLIVDIGPADFELRSAILLIKAKQRGMQLPMEMAQLIATHIEGVRELQGVLVRIATHMELTHQPLSEQMITEVLKITPTSNGIAKVVTPTEVMNVVGNFYGIGVQQLKGERRTKMVAWPRQILMYLLRQELRLPLEEVGRLVGGRDHTTVLHAADKVRVELEKNERFKSEMQDIKRRIFSTHGE